MALSKGISAFGGLAMLLASAASHGACVIVKGEYADSDLKELVTWVHENRRTFVGSVGSTVEDKLAPSHLAGTFTNGISAAGRFKRGNAARKCAALFDKVVKGAGAETVSGVLNCGTPDIVTSRAEEKLECRR